MQSHDAQPDAAMALKRQRHYYDFLNPIDKTRLNDAECFRLSVRKRIPVNKGCVAVAAIYVQHAELFMHYFQNT